MYPSRLAYLSVVSLAATALAQSAAEKVANLRLAAAQRDRIKLLQDNEYVFDFLHPPSGVSTGAGGHTVAADSDSFPALIGNNIAMTIGFLGPCGFNTPHTHPRATEINFAVNGTLKAGFLAENGARFIMNDVPPGSVTVFPKGAIHFEMNDSCDNVMFVAAFDSEDPGVLAIAQRFFGLPPEFVSASLGEIGVEQVAHLEALIPDNIALGTEECLQRCGITVGSQPGLQRQPRVAANALPSGFSGPAPPTGSSPTGAPSVPTPPGGMASTAPSAPQPSASVTPPSQAPFSGAVSEHDALKDPSGRTNALVIALIVVCGVLVLGYAALAVAYFMRRRNERMERTRGGRYFRTGDAFEPHMPVEKTNPYESSYDTPAVQTPTH